MAIFTRTIDTDVVSISPFSSGARREAAARVIAENVGTIMNSRLGLQSDDFAKSVNRAALTRISDALLCPDCASIQIDGSGDHKALTRITVASLPTAVLLPLLAFAWQCNFLTEFV